MKQISKDAFLNKHINSLTRSTLINTLELWAMKINAKRKTKKKLARQFLYKRTASWSCKNSLSLNFKKWREPITSEVKICRNKKRSRKTFFVIFFAADYLKLSICCCSLWNKNEKFASLLNCLLKSSIFFKVNILLNCCNKFRPNICWLKWPKKGFWICVLLSLTKIRWHQSADNNHERC